LELEPAAEFSFQEPDWNQTWSWIRLWNEYQDQIHSNFFSKTKAESSSQRAKTTLLLFI
jgi:hypothetical protein